MNSSDPSGEPTGKSSRRLGVFLPLVLFALLAGGMFYALSLKAGGGLSNQVPSALLGKPVPDFKLEPMPGLVSNGTPIPGFAAADLAGEGVNLINVWASWCVPCRQEHPVLMDLAKDKRFRLLGLNYKDKPDNARRFLGSLGNPYERVGVDPRGRTGIDWGVYGVPETFVVARGRILYKFIGPLSPESLKARLMPEIEKALAGPAKPAS